MKPQVVGNQNILLRTVKHTEAALNTLWYYAKLHIIIYTITIKNGGHGIDTLSPTKKRAYNWYCCELLIVLSM